MCLAATSDHFSRQRNIRRNHEVAGRKQFHDALIGDVHSLGRSFRRIAALPILRRHRHFAGDHGGGHVARGGGYQRDGLLVHDREDFGCDDHAAGNIIAL